MTRILRLATPFLLAVTSLAQVQVSVSSSKTEYLAGEPIYAILRITNIGQDPVANPGFIDRVDLTVIDASPRIIPNLYGCFSGFGRGRSLSGVDHPPFLMPGKTFEERVLLRNYLLAPGEYSLRVDGDSRVYWKFYGGVTSTGKFKNGDAVPGATFDQTVKLRVLPATEAELRSAYVPYVDRIDMEFPLYPSRDAIAEMAPPFLEKTILSFATQPQSAFFAVRGLERIDTAESRADLVALYEKSYDLHLRAAIVESLARYGQRGPTFIHDQLARRA